MPPNEQVLEKALEALQQVEVQSFTATPPVIGPFGQAELRWRVSAPPTVRLLLDGRDVPNDGSQVVRPTETRTFTLTASTVGLSAQVAQQTVLVNLDACAIVPVPETDVQSTLLDVVSTLLAEDPQISNRKPPFVDVTSSGIVLKLRFEVEIKGRNPDFNVDALIGLGVDSSGIVPFFREFKADLDFSFWEDVLNFTIGAVVAGPFLQLAIAMAESNAQDKARRDILAGVRAGFAASLAMLPTGWAPHRVFLKEDGIDVRICPKPRLARIDSFRHAGFSLVAAVRAPREPTRPRGKKAAAKTKGKKKRSAKRPAK